MEEVFNEKVDERMVEFWSTVRGDIEKFDNIISSNYVQHMTILVAFVTLSAFFYIGGFESNLFCSIISFIVSALAILFKRQNTLYQKFLGNNIEFAKKIEVLIFKDNYRLTEVLDDKQPIEAQERRYKISYYLIFFVAIIMGFLSVFQFLIFFGLI